MSFEGVERVEFEFVAEAMVEIELDHLSVEGITGVVEEEGFNRRMSSLDGGAGSDACSSIKCAERSMRPAGVDTMRKGAKLGRAGEIGGGIAESSTELLSTDYGSFDLEGSIKEGVSESTIPGLNSLPDLR